MSGKKKKNKQKSGQQVQQETKKKKQEAQEKKNDKKLAKNSEETKAKMAQEKKKEAEKLKDRKIACLAENAIINAAELFQDYNADIEKKMPIIDQCLKKLEGGEENVALSEQLAALQDILELKDKHASYLSLIGFGYGISGLNNEDISSSFVSLAEQIWKKTTALINNFQSSMIAKCEKLTKDANNILGMDYREDNYGEVSSALLKCKNELKQLHNAVKIYHQCVKRIDDMIVPSEYEALLNFVVYWDEELQKCAEQLGALDNKMLDYEYGDEYQGYLERKENEEENSNANKDNNGQIPFPNFTADTQQHNQQSQTVPFDFTQAMGNLNHTNQNSIHLNTINGKNELDDMIKSMNTIRFTYK